MWDGIAKKNIIEIATNSKQFAFCRGISKDIYRKSSTMTNDVRPGFTSTTSPFNVYPPSEDVMDRVYSPGRRLRRAR